MLPGVLAPILRCANGTRMRTEGVGELNEFVTNVIVCPKVRENLLSVEKLRDADCSVEFFSKSGNPSYDRSVGGVVKGPNNEVLLVFDKQHRVDMAQFGAIAHVKLSASTVVQGGKDFHLPSFVAEDNPEESPSAYRIYGAPKEMSVAEKVTHLHGIGHQSKEDMINLCKNAQNYPVSVKQIKKHFPKTCEICLKGKMQHRSMRKRPDKTLEDNEDQSLSASQKESQNQVETLDDVLVPMKLNKKDLNKLQARNLTVGHNVGIDTYVGPHSGDCIFMSTDKASGYVYSVGMEKQKKGREKQAAECLTLMLRHYEKHGHHFSSYGKPIVEINGDKHSIFASNEVDVMMKKEGVKLTLSPPNNQYKNGLAESTNKTIARDVTCMYAQARHVPEALWSYAWTYACILHNLNKSNVPGSSKTRVAEFTGKQVDFEERAFMPFGTPVEYIVAKEDRSWKFGDRSYPGIFVGVSPTTPKAILVFSFVTRRIVVRVSYRIMEHVPSAWTMIDPKVFVFDGPAEEVTALKQLEESESEDMVKDVALPRRPGGKQQNEAPEAESQRATVATLPYIPQITNKSSAKKGSKQSAAVTMNNSSVATNLQQHSDTVAAAPVSSPHAPAVGSPTELPTANKDKTGVESGNTSGETASMGLPTVAAGDADNPTMPLGVATQEGVGSNDATTGSLSSPAGNAPLTSEVGDAEQQNLTSHASAHSLRVSKQAGRRRGPNKRAKKVPKEDVWECARAINLVNALMKKQPKKKKKKKGKDEDSPSLEEARKRPDWPKFQEAIDAELEQLDSEGAGTRVQSKDIDKGTKILGSMFILTVKRLPNGCIDRYKARLVILGNQQTKDQYASIRSPTARTATVKLAIALQAKMPRAASAVMDVKGAYLKSPIDLEKERLFVKLPNGQYVLLNKYVYGLKQAGFEWNQLLSKTLLKHGFAQSKHDPCLFFFHKNGVFVYAVVHVDDLYVIASSPEEIDKFHEFLNFEFGEVTMKSGDVLAYLGMQVTREGSDIHVNQPGYVEKILKKAGIHPKQRTDLPYTEELTVDQPDEAADKTRYLELVGMINYLAVLTRPDLLYALSKCAQKCSCPTNLDMARVLKIFKYVNATKELGLTFRPDDDFKLRCWVDASHIQYAEDAKSHYGYAFFMGSDDSCFYAKSAKMKIVTPGGSTESEYVALYEAATEVVFLRNLLEEIGFPQDGPTPVYEDNKSTIAMAQGGGSFQKQKHILVKYHYSRELVKEKVMELVHCGTEDMVADMLTKSTTKSVLKHLRNLLMRPDDSHVCGTR